MIKCVGATKEASEKINVHCADFDLFAGLSWLHSLREMQLDVGGTCSPSVADFDLFAGLSWLHSLREMQPNTRGTCLLSIVDFDLFAGFDGCIRFAKCSLILAVYVHHPLRTLIFSPD